MKTATAETDGRGRRCLPRPPFRIRAPASAPAQFLWLLSLLSLLAACAGGGLATPEALPPQSTVPRAPSGETATAPGAASGESENPPVSPEIAGKKAADPATIPEPGAERKKSDPTVLVIDPGGLGPATPQDIVAAARAERERRKSSGPAIAVVTDKNLAEMGKGGRLTTATPAPARASDERAAPTALVETRETYWKERLRSARERWKNAADGIAALQGEAARLREQFYAVDDPYRRDREIKPAWDLALEKLERAKREVVAAQEELARALEEGRQAGALPGWLLEGVELEPAAAPAERTKPGEPRTGAEPREPSILPESDPPP